MTDTADFSATATASWNLPDEETVPELEQ